MRGFRLFVALLVGLSIALAGCESEPPAPTLDPGIIAALAPACSGIPVAGSGSMVTSGGPINHLVLLDASGQPLDMTHWLPDSWQPASLADAELVACVPIEPTRTVLQVCPYYGSDITRYAVTRDFKVVEASSGRTVAAFAITAEPRICHSTEIDGVTELEGTIVPDVVIAHLAGLVEHGRFIDPDVSGPSVDPGQTATPSTLPEKAELRQALADGLVSVAGTGDGLQQLDLELTSEVDRALDVTIEAGTLLEPRARGTQQMIVMGAQTVSLSAGESVSVSLDVACGEMNQDQPTGDDSFRVLNDQPAPDLVRLLAVPELADASDRVEQFAIWTITNNPKRNDYVGLTSGFSVFGSGPDDEEIDQIRTLFEAAGIDLGNYRALR